MKLTSIAYALLAAHLYHLHQNLMDHIRCLQYVSLQVPSKILQMIGPQDAHVFQRRPLRTGHRLPRPHIVFPFQYHIQEDTSSGGTLGAGSVE